MIWQLDSTVSDFTESLDCEDLDMPRTNTVGGPGTGAEIMDKGRHEKAGGPDGTWHAP